MKTTIDSDALYATVIYIGLSEMEDFSCEARKMNCDMMENLFSKRSKYYEGMKGYIENLINAKSKKEYESQYFKLGKYLSGLIDDFPVV